jgi:PAS domain S-box-containing protein
MAGEVSTERAVFLSLQPAGRGERRRALGVVLLSLLIFAVVAPFARTKLTRIDAFIPAYESALLINDLITAVLLFGQFSILRSRSLLVLAGGYMFTALIVIPHALSFPGVFSETGLLGAGGQTTSWLYMFWHGGFPLVVVVYALIKNSKAQSDQAPHGSPWGPILFAIALAAGAVVALALLATVGEGLLPAIMTGNIYSRTLNGVVMTVWMSSVVALVVLLMRRPHSVLDVWLMVVVCAWVLDVALSAVLVGGRYDLGFYAGRIYGMLAASFVLVMLLLENSTLYARLARSFQSVGAAKAQVDDYARRLEGQVQVSEEKYRLFMEHARVGIFAVDADGRIVEANREMSGLLARPRQDIIGCRFDDLLSTANAPEIRSSVGKLLSEASFRIEGLLLQRADEQKVYVDITSSRITVANAPLTLFIARDVTERTRLEQQLRQAQKMEAIGQLTGGLAHDFNNLLAVMVGNLELLSDQIQDRPKMLEMANTALQAALGGAELTRQLLAFSRQQTLQARRIDVNDLVADMIKLLSRTLGEDIEMVFNRGTDLWPVMIDPPLFGSAIANLATNARDAMPNGGKLIFDTYAAELDADYAATNPEVVPGEYVVLAVTDTGAGIPPETLARVFEPFFTTKPMGKGTGLGLSMVFGFVKQSGGHIKIYSEIGKGTIIRIYLPRAKGEQGGETAAPRQARPVARTGDETIIVVDDNAAVRQTTVKQLASLGYRAIEADTPNAALAALKRADKIDLLFTDIVMPGGMTGRDLAREALALRPELKVMYTSGFLGSASRDAIQLHPDDAFLSKPYRLQDLAERLRQVLDRA